LTNLAEESSFTVSHSWYSDHPVPTSSPRWPSLPRFDNLPRSPSITRQSRPTYSHCDSSPRSPAILTCSTATYPRVLGSRVARGRCYPKRSNQDHIWSEIIMCPSCEPDQSAASNGSGASSNGHANGHANGNSSNGPSNGCKTSMGSSSFSKHETDFIVQHTQVSPVHTRRQSALASKTHS
jgi:hypothetical protein